MASLLLAGLGSRKRGLWRRALNSVLIMTPNLPRQVLVYQPVNSFMGVAPLAGLHRNDNLRGARRSGKANALMSRDPCEGCLSGHQPTLRRPAGEGACAVAGDVGLPDASCSSQPAQGDPPRRAATR